MQEILFDDFSGQHQKVWASTTARILSTESTNVGRSTEPNERFRLDVLVIECKQREFSLAFPGTFVRITACSTILSMFFTFLSRELLGVLVVCVFCEVCG